MSEIFFADKETKSQRQHDLKTQYLQGFKEGVESAKATLFTHDEVIAMLTDLDLQIDESAAYNLEVAKVQRLIRDKINALRGEKDGKRIC